MIVRPHILASHPTSKRQNDPFYRAATSLADRALADAMGIDRMTLTGRFGVELEMEGISLDQLREIVAAYLGPEARGVKGGILDKDGRLWEVKPDILPVVELATPPLCGADDVRLLQGLAQRLTQAGATVSEETGVHVHVDARKLDERQIVRLLGLVAHHESSLVSALKVHASRLFFCGDARLSALAPMVADVPKGRAALMRAYRGPHAAKCLGLNVEHLAPGHFGTLELRYFNGTLNPSIIGCHVGLASAFVRFASKDGPLPAVESITGDGDLPTLLHKLDLQPHDPPSIFLYRNMLGLKLPRAHSTPMLHPAPTMLEVAPFVRLEVDKDIARQILTPLRKAARSSLLDAARTYVKATKSKALHGREMLALSRLDPQTRKLIIGEYGSALGRLQAAEHRAEGLAWLASNPDDLLTIRATFGEFPLLYAIAAPRAMTMRLLGTLRAMHVPLRPEAISRDAFQKLAYMDDAQVRFCLDAWQRRAHHASDDLTDRGHTLEHVLACLRGVSQPDALRVMDLLDKAGMPWDAYTLSAGTFRVLADLPDAQTYLDVWLAYAPVWCPTPLEKQRFLDDIVSIPIDLLQARVAAIAALPGPSPKYAPHPRYDAKYSHGSHGRGPAPRCTPLKKRQECDAIAEGFLAHQF